MRNERMNIMRLKKDYKTVLRERARDLETLIYYFSVTRVIHCEAYYDSAGGFSYTKFKTQKGWVTYWNDKTPEYKKLHYKTYAIYQKTYNEVLGIPCDLVNDILGEYTPTGKRISFDEALNEIGGAAKWKVIEDGQSAYTDKETNERIVKDSWRRKVYPAIPLEWSRLIRNQSYYRLETIPNASQRAIEIIKAWEVANKFLPLVKAGASLETLKQKLISSCVRKPLVKRIMTMLNRMMKKH